MSTYTAASPDISGLTDTSVNSSASVKTPIANLKTAIETLGNLVTPTAQVCNGRLTLTSGTAVTTSDVTAATTIYFTPYKGNTVTIYDGTNWIPYAFTELSLSLAGYTASTPHDIFLYNNSGTLTLSPQAWTNDTTRATAITLQNGVYVKSGSTGYRFLGTIRTTSTIGQTESSISKRFVSNYYNPLPMSLKVRDTTDSWTYATASYTSWNASTANRVEFVRCVNEIPVSLEFTGLLSQTGSVAGGIGIGLGSTTVNSAYVYTYGIPTFTSTIVARYSDMPALGYNYLQLLQYATGATVTFYGDVGATYIQSGAIGAVWG